jgi:hypothetical protein
MRSVVAFLALTIKTTMPVIPAPTAAPVHIAWCLPACLPATPSLTSQTLAR